MFIQSKFKPFYFIFGVSLLFSLSAVAGKLRCESLWRDERLSSDLLAKLPDRDSGPGFIVPNEREIGGAAHSFAALPEGIYVTVGTERGLMSAGLARGKVKALVQVDRDDKVALYNLVNRALLAVAKNREHYLQLRLDSSQTEWLQALEQTPLEISVEDRRTLSRAEAWQWWEKNVQRSSGWSRFHQRPEQNTDLDYQGANYLFDDALFAQVSHLAKSQHIFIVHDFLGTENFVQKVAGLTEALNLRISAIDVSNAWQQGYMGHQNTLDLFYNLNSIMTPETHYIFTYMARTSVALDASSTFKYVFLENGPTSPNAALETLMGNMARSEPSQRSAPQRSRVGRYDGY